LDERKKLTGSTKNKVVCLSTNREINSVKSWVSIVLANQKVIVVAQTQSAKRDLY